MQMRTGKLDANNAAANDEYLLRSHQPLVLVLHVQKPPSARRVLAPSFTQEQSNQRQESQSIDVVSDCMKRHRRHQVSGGHSGYVRSGCGGKCCPEQG